MLSKKYHLPIQKFSKPRVNLFGIARGKYFIVKSKSNKLLFCRFGVIVSNKVSKSAVKRNKIKRTIFDFIRLKEYHLRTGKDILVIVSPQVSKLTKIEAERELENYFAQIAKR